MSLSHYPWSLSRFSKCLAFSFRCVYWPKRPPREEGERLLSDAAGSRRVISPLCFFIIRSWMNRTRDTTACPRGWNPSILGRGEARARGSTDSRQYLEARHATVQRGTQAGLSLLLPFTSFVCLPFKQGGWLAGLDQGPPKAGSGLHSRAKHGPYQASGTC